jgi:hypothetical protein
LCLSETLDDKAVKTLMRLGLSTRFPEEYEAWEKRRVEIEKRFQKILAERQADIHDSILVSREVKSEEEEELKVSRATFVRQIEHLCRERSRS